MRRAPLICTRLGTALPDIRDLLNSAKTKRSGCLQNRTSGEHTSWLTSGRCIEADSALRELVISGFDDQAKFKLFSIKTGRSIRVGCWNVDALHAENHQELLSRENITIRGS
jgi:hypothetical protein